MRFYTGKPRTVGWWKGLSYSTPGEEPDLIKWMENTRRIAIKLIEKYRIPLAEEMLHPEMSDYFDDIYSYQVVGARSVENQYHREVMSMSEVMQNTSSQPEVYDFVKWFMIESYIYDGRQDVKDFSTVKKGLSMTDPCIGLEATEMLVRELYSLVK